MAFAPSQPLATGADYGSIQRFREYRDRQQRRRNGENIPYDPQIDFPAGSPQEAELNGMLDNPDPNTRDMTDAELNSKGFLGVQGRGPEFFRQTLGVTAVDAAMNGGDVLGTIADPYGLGIKEEFGIGSGSDNYVPRNGAAGPGGKDAGLAGMATAAKQAEETYKSAQQLGQTAGQFQGYEIRDPREVNATEIAPSGFETWAPVEATLAGPAERYNAARIGAARDVTAPNMAAIREVGPTNMTAAQVGPAQTVNAPQLGPAAQAVTQGPAAQAIDRTGQAAMQAAQQRALGLVESEAAGQGVGQQLAQQQMQNALRNIAQTQMGMAAQARGSERAGARREAMLALGRQGIDVAGKAAEVGMAARLGAIGQLTGAAQGARGQDIDLAVQQAQLGQSAANLGATIGADTARFNAEAINRFGMTGAQLELAAAQGNQQAINAMRTLQAQLQQGASAQNAQQALQAAVANQGAALTREQALAQMALAAQTGNADREQGRYTAQAGLDTGANAANAAAANQINLANAQLGTNVAIGNADRGQQAEIERARQYLAAQQSNQSTNLQAQTANQGAWGDTERSRAANAVDVRNAQQTGQLGALNAQTQATNAQAAAVGDAERIRRGIADSRAQEQNAKTQAGLTALAALSDERAKTNIRDVSSADLAELAGAVKESMATWEYKPGEGPPGRHLGPMAQDVERTKLGKDFVGDRGDGMRNLDYEGLGALLMWEAQRQRKAREGRA